MPVIRFAEKMGGCLSSKNYISDDDNANNDKADHRVYGNHNTPVEEKVKEVLSEIPTRSSFSKTGENIERQWSNNNGTNEMAETSEICNLSEISTATSTTNKEEEYRIEMRRLEDRSPGKVGRRGSHSGEITYRREKSGKSPGRRIDRPWIPAGNGIRRDPAENSGRRSRSPATRTDHSVESRHGVTRSSSARKSGFQSPGRIPVSNPGQHDQGYEENRDGSWPSNESLDNPLVSLECFIFL